MDTKGLKPSDVMVSIELRLHRDGKMSSLYGKSNEVPPIMMAYLIPGLIEAFKANVVAKGIIKKLATKEPKNGT